MDSIEEGYVNVHSRHMGVQKATKSCGNDMWEKTDLSGHSLFPIWPE